MQHTAPVEVATALDCRNTRDYLFFAFNPVPCAVRIGAVQPLGVVRREIHRACELRGPFEMRRVEVRVRDDDGF